MYCRKMEREVWSNPQIVSLVETGFIPLALNSERDATIGLSIFQPLFRSDSRISNDSPVHRGRHVRYVCNRLFAPESGGRFASKRPAIAVGVRAGHAKPIVEL